MKFRKKETKAESTPMISCDSSLFAAASTQFLLARKSRSRCRTCAQAAGETPETALSLLP